MPVSMMPCENRHWPRVIGLLTDVYVGGGFATPERGAAMFRRDQIEHGGTVLIAVDEGDDVLGVVILLDLDSPMGQIAQDGEAEFRLLAVDPRGRGRGIGAMLVAECIRRAALPPWSAERLVLWTQPGMLAAQRLYERTGFRRATERDALLPPHPAGIEQWVYCREL